MKRSKGKELQKKRSELVERPFAHMLDSGGMRRVHVRGHDNIRKRLVIHAAGFNLSLIMRKVHGVGKPRALQGLRAALSAVLVAVLTLLRWLGALFGRDSRQSPPMLDFQNTPAHANPT
ncbi:transposase [Nannocystis pusilla]|uniref:Transposase n=1 Tax=Nannocystis pusilla TaxID=889268 RepID=A0ABS7TUE3_9BACT|nr:transposase [Nannocystis pusilla]MBZ5711691.1 transposase [Nannocystis pusilla]